MACRNAAPLSGLSTMSAPGLSRPTRKTFAAAVWDLACIGRVVAAPTSPAMNSRRLMDHLTADRRVKHDTERPPRARYAALARCSIAVTMDAADPHLA